MKTTKIFSGQKFYHVEDFIAKKEAKKAAVEYRKEDCNCRVVKDSFTKFWAVYCRKKENNMNETKSTEIQEIKQLINDRKAIVNERLERYEQKIRDLEAKIQVMDAREAKMLEILVENSRKLAALEVVLKQSSDPERLDRIEKILERENSND
ncbi:MAG: hypothetical protein QNJ54_34455 [Prochloraceae cyanobacterium]|nr:hypothetical protein [Prochloraceae cyanobacterium]